MNLFTTYRKPVYNLLTIELILTWYGVSIELVLTM